jgi:hypothetical protein
MGDIALWKWSPPLGGKKVEGEQKWKLQAPATVEGSVRQVEVQSNIDRHNITITCSDITLLLHVQT